MRSYKNYKQLFDEPNTEKQWEIQIVDGEDIYSLGNTDLFSKGIELVESISESEQLEFGGCISSSMTFEVKSNSLPLSSMVGKRVSVWIHLDGDGAAERLPIGKFYVYTDTRANNGFSRTLKCYDELSVLPDCASWYNDLDFPMTLKSFRDSLFTFLNLNVVDITLVNDWMQVNKTITSNSLSSLEVLKKICQINGVFGRIRYDSTFDFISLTSGKDALYPSDTLYPSDELFPSDGNIRRLSLNVGDSEFYETKKISSVIIRMDEESEGVEFGSGNPLVIDDNFLLYGKSDSELRMIAEALLNKVKDIKYTPFSAKALGNPCWELGDCVRLNARNGLFYSYILERTITGCQGLIEWISAKGLEEREEVTNTFQSEIRIMKNRTHKIVNTIDEFSSEITELQNEDTRLSSRISQTAGDISLEVRRATEKEGELSSAIKLKPDTLSLSVGSETQGKVGITMSWKENGVEKTASGEIDLSGKVTFSDLSSSGSTTINGDNIKTGTIDAARIKVSDLKVTGIYDNNGRSIIFNSGGKPYVQTEMVCLDDVHLLTGNVYVDDGLIDTKSLTAYNFNFKAKQVRVVTLNYQDWQGDTKSIDVLAVSDIT